MTYTELYDAVLSYTQNYEQEFAANIPVFVKQVEKRVYNSVQIPALRRNQTGVLTTGNKYLSTPPDFLSVYSLAVITNFGAAGENYTFLLNKDVNFIRAAYPSSLDQGLPEYYAIFGPTTVGSTITTELSFIVGPTPDDNYAVEMHYYYYPESIVDAGTSWLGDNYDPVLLYGTLVEAITFMKGEADMVTLYNTKYQEALAQLNRLGTGLERGDAYRDGQAKIKVSP